MNSITLKASLCNNSIQITTYIDGKTVAIDYFKTEIEAINAKPTLKVRAQSLLDQVKRVQEALDQE